MSFIGIDLGTSAVKVIMMEEDGHIIADATRSYPCSYPKSGWSEQDPKLWFNETLRAFEELIKTAGNTQVSGIGIAGQMHGLVMLDERDQVIRPAILWNDSRSTEETDYLNNEIGQKELSKYTANIAFTGFTAPKILWVKKNEPQNYARIKKIMLPKDYLIYRLTGEFATDVSDASGTLYFDVKERKWSSKMCDILGIKEDMLPKVYESYEVVGTLKNDMARELSLPAGIKVVAGAGDNAAAAVGVGAVAGGGCNLSIGTSGTIFIPTREFRVDPKNALHAFAAADGGYHLMGCMLSAASCNKWWMENILTAGDYSKEQANVKRLGRNNVYFLPYLMGERSPHNDPYARGTFIGMTMDTDRTAMTQAVFEGVAFALRDSVDIARKLGISVENSFLCGGGAKSSLWRHILANVLKLRLDLPMVEEGPSYGTAILAAVGCGVFDSVEAASKQISRVGKSIEPVPELMELYEDRYRRFSGIYPALKSVYRAL